MAYNKKSNMEYREPVDNIDGLAYAQEGIEFNLKRMLKRNPDKRYEIQIHEVLTEAPKKSKNGKASQTPQASQPSTNENQEQEG